MKTLIQNGRVIDPASGFDQVGDVGIDNGKISFIGAKPESFNGKEIFDATDCIVAPGLVDLCARLREPGYEHEGMLQSEMNAAVVGGVTTLVCPPDTDPVLDQPGLVDMFAYKADRLHLARVLPLGAFTKGLKGEELTEMLELTQAGCVGFGQADVALINTQVMQRGFQYATTHGYSVWLRPLEGFLDQGVAASGPLATRLGLSGVPVAAETIALHTIFALMRTTGARVHVSRVSSAAGVDLIREAKAEGLSLTCDVSINSLHLTDMDIGFFDSRARVNPPLRQQRDREALRIGLADGTIDALVSDHTPVEGDAKALPFAQAEAGATGLELLLSLSIKWAAEQKLPIARALAVISNEPAKVIQHSKQHLRTLGQLTVGGVADVCVFDPSVRWQALPANIKSQGKHTPFSFDRSGVILPAKVKATWVDGHLAFNSKV
ncbi:MAG: dihydroorotase [Limnohabitans sp.]|nr:dihydroorotase [Limnohabitans sp.]